MPTLTYYSVSADLTTLYAILNGVAMICQQWQYIWSFAFAVCMWRLLSTSVGAAFSSARGAAAGTAVLANGSISAFIPFVLALLLTSPQLQGTVQLESTINGAVEEVDHVPFVISALPAAGSILSMSLNQYVSTAFGNVSAEYPAISATANGFMNPMKILLSSRTAMYRLGGVDSEVKSILATCLGPDSGVNYASIQSLVSNAGNSGATAAQSIEVNGANPTAIGALLYQAAQNTSGMVNDPSISSGNTMMTCADAAQQVANDVTTALNSVEFPRVMLGAVNGMDQLLPNADFSFNTIAAQYDALSTANTLGNVFTGGTAQANAEFMNLLFSEMVGNDLTCLRATSDTLTECQATALQASEVERNNLQEAASEVPMLRYAGSFGNDLIALIIGLGPVIVMLMMFSGMSAGKTLVTAAHLIVWPLLAVNVGAEVINGMICIKYANYLNVLRQGGWLSHAATVTAYKELSLQIGTASHIMASLPILMSMIFGLGEGAALTSVAQGIAPKDREVSENVAPRAEATAPMFQNGSIGTGTQFGNGAARLMMTGAVEAAASSVSYGNAATDATRTLTQASTQSETIAEGQSDVSSIRRAVTTGDFSRFTSDSAVGSSLVRNFQEEQRELQDTSAGSRTGDSKANTNATKVGVGGGLSFGVEGGKPEVGGSIGAHGSTEAGAQDAASRDHYVANNESLNNSLALSRALTRTMQEFQNTSHGTQASRDLTKALDRQESYQRTLSNVQSTSDAATQALRDSDTFLDLAGSMHSDQIVWQNQTNADFKHFQLTSGRMAQENPTWQKYLNLAQSEATSGATDRVSDASAQAAVNRHRAAVLLAHDKDANPEHRVEGLQYLAQEGTAMFHAAISRDVPEKMATKIDAPENRTGLPGFSESTAPMPSARAPQGGGIPTLQGVRHEHAAADGHLASHAPAASAPGDVAATAQPSPNFGSDLEAKVTGGVATAAAKMKQASSRADQFAQYAGLGESGPGTVRRTGSLVADNAIDTARAAGSPSMTGMGNDGKPVPSASDDKPKNATSKFVRR